MRAPSTCTVLLALLQAGSCFAQNPLSRTGWKATADSQETANANNVAANVLDGAADTMWHSKWSGTPTPLPHTLTIVMDASHRINGITYLPRQDPIAGGGSNGNIGASQTQRRASRCWRSLPARARLILLSAPGRLRARRHVQVAQRHDAKQHLLEVQIVSTCAGKYEIRVSTDGTTFPATALKAGTWADDQTLKTVTFTARDRQSGAHHRAHGGGAAEGRGAPPQR